MRALQTRRRDSYQTGSAPARAAAPPPRGHQQPGAPLSHAGFSHVRFPDDPGRNLAISEISNFRKFEFAPAMALERPWRCGPGLVAALVLCVPAAQPTQVPAKVSPAFLDAAPLPHTAVAAAAARRAATRVTMKKRQREQAKPLPVANVPQGAARPRLVVFDLDNTLWTPVGGRGGRDAKCMGGVSRG